MASAWLYEQLQKLSVPQSAIYKNDKKNVSLLFNPKEAALKDRDTFYEIGLSGLKELIVLYEGFRVFEDSLFSVSSKDFERAVQSEEVNQNLDQTIEKFLLQLSPYLHLESSHRALEWLVNRYRIHKYNQDAIMMLILPYHETEIFIRFIQLFKLSSTSNRWNWLESVQKRSIPLPKQVLYDQCVSNTSTLSFIAETVLKYVTEFGERATQLNTVYAFFRSAAKGSIHTCDYVTKSIIKALLPTIKAGLESSVKDFRSSAYVILGYLSTNATFKKKTINKLIVRLIDSSTEFDSSYDVVMLINLIYMNQISLTRMPEDILCKISIDVMKDFCKHLKKLVKLKISIQQFSLVFLSSILPIIQGNAEDYHRFCKLPEILIDKINFKTQQPEKIIRCALNALKATNAEPNDDESDTEITDEEDDFSSKILSWYSQFLKNLKTKYPEAFDKVIESVMGSESEMPSETKAQLSKLLVIM